MSDFDAVVVGAGPAGSLAAARLAGAGKRVLLVDRATFPRDKVCGGCLQPAALRVLKEAGLLGLLDRLPGNPLDSMVLHAGRARARIRLGGGVAVTRRALDLLLVEAAVARGVLFREGLRARLGEVRGGCREVVLETGERVRAGVVLDASGLAGVLSGAAPASRGSLLGAGAVLDVAPAGLPLGAVRMACGPGGYVGMVRAEGGRSVVAAALSPGLVAREGGLASAAGSILDSCGLPPLPAEVPWRGTPALTRRPEKPWRERVLAIGDAAGYVEPFTGEGIAWALRSALAAADLAAEGWTAATGPRWARMHRRIVGVRQRGCRAIARLLRAPALVRAAVAVLRRAPVLARPFVRAAAEGSAS